MPQSPVHPDSHRIGMLQWKDLMSEPLTYMNNVCSKSAYSRELWEGGQLSLVHMKSHEQACATIDCKEENAWNRDRKMVDLTYISFFFLMYRTL